MYIETNQNCVLEPHFIVENKGTILSNPSYDVIIVLGFLNMQVRY